MENNRRTVIIIVAMIEIVCIALLLALTIYTYNTPKVYAAPVQQGLIGGQVFDCVIPKDALFDENIMYILTPKETVLGTRYRVTTEEVDIIAEENGMVAVTLYGSMDEMYFVLAHDGRMKASGEVLVYRS